MRHSIIDHDYNPTLCSLLEVSGGSGGGSGPGGGPPVQMLYVAPNGNDTTGNGSLAFPYLTIGKAETVASPLASLLHPYVIMAAPGTYAAPPLLFPYVSISGLDPSSPPVITGSPSVAPGFPGGGTIGLNNLTWTNAVPINFGAAANPVLTLTNNDFKAALSVTGTGGGITVMAKNNIVEANTTLTDVSTVLTEFNKFSAPVALIATNFNMGATSTGDVMSDGLSVTAAVAKTNIVEALGSSVSGGSGLTLTGAGVSYTGTFDAIPSVVTTSGGASPPVAIASNGGPSQGDWSDGNVTIAAPTNLTRDMYYKTLTVTSTLSTKGFRIYADVIQGTGVIDNSGGNAAGSAHGAGASGAGPLGNGTDGGDGVFSNAGSGGIAGNPGVSQLAGFGNESGTGGTGGTAGVAAGGAGGARSVLAATVGGIRAQPSSLSGLVYGSSIATTFGGTGGGSGGSNGGITGATSGGGGGGAGPILIGTRVLSGSVTIRANGGTGGAASGTDGNAAGGAGGGGAPITISANDRSGYSGTVQSNGGAGGAGFGTGAAGGVGANGSVIQLVT